MSSDAVIEGIAHPENEQLVATAYSTIDALSADNTVRPFLTMTLWALFNNGDKIVDIVRRQAADAGTFYELEVIYLDEFDVLREHEEFPELLQELGLSGYWSSIGCRWHQDRVSCNAGT